jgi:hypothetical protein
MEPLKATGMVVTVDYGFDGSDPDEEVPEGGAKVGEVLLLGTAFAFRTGQHYLTAAHCIGDLSPSDIYLNVRGLDDLMSVAHVERHPTADVALLVLESDIEQAEPFMLIREEQAIGPQFFAFGYPEDAMEGKAPSPKPRVFIGHYQRFFHHKSLHTDREYDAVELSIPAPGGLSGGPVFPQELLNLVSGLVTENYESTTRLQAVEDINAAGEKRTIQYQTVISYGIAALLDPLRDWIEERVPSVEVAMQRKQRQHEASGE